MPKVLVGGKIVNIDPTVSELSTYQKHGLKPSDRKPTDYLRMVARTFSSFRKTPAEETVVSYIHGFEVTVNDEEIPVEVDWLIQNKTYNIFKIKSGACMIDNQLIDIYEDTYYIFEETELLAGLKYGVVIEYDYIEQRADNIARIRFIDYDALHFPRAEDQSVVTCDYIDTSLDGVNSTIEFSGKPGLLIATFKVAEDVPNTAYAQDAGKIIQSNPPVIGDHVYGIDPQYLSKLYIQNYKLLFEYFGDQSRAIYSSMGMTNANFFAVAEEQLYKIGDPETDLRSGDMCYLDEETGLYKRSEASQQHFSKVVGLYLNEYNEGNHLIYTGGVITLNAEKHNLPADHTLLTMNTGSHYFLQDANTLFDTNNQTRTIENYILTDSSGQISSRYYPSAVRVGFATACNQLVLSIEHANEIQTNNLLSLFGTAEEYEREYTANDTVINMDTANEYLEKRNLDLELKVADYEEKLGTNPDGSDINHSAEIGLLYNTNSATNPNYYTSDPEILMMILYKILPRWFKNGTRAEDIWGTALNINSNEELSQIDSGKRANFITDVSLNFRTFRDISLMLVKLKILIDSVYAQKFTFLSTYLSTFKDTQKETFLKINAYKLQIARFEIGDDFENVEYFENVDLIINDAQTFSAKISLLKTAIESEEANAQANLEQYTTDVGYINTLKSMGANIQVYIDIMESMVDRMNIVRTDASIEKITNANQILANTLTRDNAAANVLNSDSLKLDIFLMDDHQRTIFNYTYITDRLRKRLSMVNTLSDDLLRAQTTYNTIINNPDSTIIDKITALEEVNRLENFIQSNNNLISNYTAEYNRIRVFTLGEAPVTEGDLFFDELSYSNQKIGAYRYGCDDYETTYGSLSSNLISSPCGPYTSNDSIIIPKNYNESEIDVIGNDSHSRGENIYIHNVSQPQHGSVRLEASSIVYYHAFDEDISAYVLVDTSGNFIDVPKSVNGKDIIFDVSSINPAGYRVAINSTFGSDIASGYTKAITAKVFFTPEPNYAGIDLFVYTIIDDNGQIATGSVNVVVTGPYTTPDTFTVIKDSSDVSLDVLVNDGHTASERIAIISNRDGLIEPARGSITILEGDANPGTYEPGVLRYTPNAGYTGIDNFEYKIIDESGAVAIGKVKIIIT